MEAGEKTDQAYPCPACTRNLVVHSAHDHITGWTNQIAVCWKAQDFVCDCMKSNALGNMLERRAEKVIHGSTDWNQHPTSLRFCTHQRYWNCTISVYHKIIRNIFFPHAACRQWLCWRSRFLGGRQWRVAEWWLGNRWGDVAASVKGLTPDVQMPRQ
jgi:hypothetical protein